jgi:uncharacterized phiE125 gp8 family phage protein
MALTVVTAPAVEPVSLTEAKLHCRVDVSDDDNLITALIQAAREVAEAISRRALITQTWKLILDEFPATDEIVIPLPPLQSVASVTYKDQDGSSSTFSSGDYIVSTDTEPGKVVLGYGKSWPSTTLYPTGAVTVQFTAGFGDASTDVPEKYRQAMLLLIGHWYENREAIAMTGAVPKEVPFGVEALLWLDRNMGFP